MGMEFAERSSSWNHPQIQVHTFPVVCFDLDPWNCHKTVSRTKLERANYWHWRERLYNESFRYLRLVDQREGDFSDKAKKEWFIDPRTFDKRLVEVPIMPFVMPLVIEVSGGPSLSSARHQATLVSCSTRASDRKFLLYWSSSCGYDFKYIYIPIFPEEMPVKTTIQWWTYYRPVAYEV